MTRVKRYTANGEHIWVVLDDEVAKVEALFDTIRKHVKTGRVNGMTGAVIDAIEAAVKPLAE